MPEPSLPKIRQPYKLTYSFERQDLATPASVPQKGSISVAEADGRWILKVEVNDAPTLIQLHWNGATLVQFPSSSARNQAYTMSTIAQEGFSPNTVFNLYLPFQFANLTVYHPHTDAEPRHADPKILAALRDRYNGGNIAVGERPALVSGNLAPRDSKGVSSLTVGGGRQIATQYNYSDFKSALGVDIPQKIDVTLWDFDPQRDGVTIPKERYKLVLTSIQEKDAKVERPDDILNTGEWVNYYSKDNRGKSVVFSPDRGTFDQQLARQPLRRGPLPSEKPAMPIIPLAIALVAGTVAFYFFLRSRRLRAS